MVLLDEESLLMKFKVFMSGVILVIRLSCNLLPLPQVGSEAAALHLQPESSS